MSDTVLATVIINLLPDTSILDISLSNPFVTKLKSPILKLLDFNGSSNTNSILFVPFTIGGSTNWGRTVSKNVNISGANVILTLFPTIVWPTFTVATSFIGGSNINTSLLLVILTASVSLSVFVVPDVSTCNSISSLLSNNIITLLFSVNLFVTLYFPLSTFLLNTWISSLIKESASSGIGIIDLFISNSPFAASKSLSASFILVMTPFKNSIVRFDCKIALSSPSIVFTDDVVSLILYTSPVFDDGTAFDISAKKSSLDIPILLDDIAPVNENPTASLPHRSTTGVLTVVVAG